jgi:MarR-like DNA-binding transcriptional regulator SgrR of sgrS sRNA
MFKNVLDSTVLCAVFFECLFLLSVSVVQVFTDELRSVSATLETNSALMQGLQGDLQECKDVVRETLREVILLFATTNRTTGKTEPEVDPVEVGMEGWPQIIIVWVLLSCWLQLGLIAHRLEVPRTTVS